MHLTARSTALELEQLGAELFISIERENGIAVQIHAYGGALWVTDGGCFALGVAEAGKPLLDHATIAAVCGEHGAKWEAEIEHPRIIHRLPAAESLPDGVACVGACFDALIEAQRAFTGEGQRA